MDSIPKEVEFDLDTERDESEPGLTATADTAGPRGDVETMAALRIHAEGGPQGLVYERAPIPEPAIGDVLVRVTAASFTPTELAWPSTWVDRSGRSRAPVIPGHELCGVVAALGYGTFGFEVGDPVYGLSDWYRDGTAAEYVAVEARNLARKPAELNDVEAAAMPMAALTATQALLQHGRLSGGQTGLIIGAGGGVGSLAVQIGHATGARIVGGGRSRARDRVLELGAEEFVDLEADALEAMAGRFDLVFDLVGGDVLGRTWALLRPGGMLVSVVEDPSSRPEAREDARSALFVVEPDRAALDDLADQVKNGELRPQVGDVRPLAEGREAFAVKRAGGIPGKTVLTVGNATAAL
jgi:NADPH:quinone reductase-like Zn-dependent oxidoreductase